jgi:hypothetical protein
MKDKKTKETTQTKEKKPKNFKKFKYGSMSAIVLVLVVAIVVVLNLIVSLLMDRYPLKVDLTSDKRYELCDESIEFLESMDDDVEITVTYPKETLLQYSYYQIIPEILEKYEIYARSGDGSVEVSYVDITKNPDAVSKYSDYYSGTISEGMVVVRSGEKVKVISLYNLFQTSSSSYYSSDSSVTFVGESSITSAIMSVTDANPVNVAFATYMNGGYTYGDDSSAYYSVESFKSLLSSNGYECTDVDVMTDEISPDDYNLLVIPAPSSDFNDDIIEKLEDFLYNDGNYGRNVIYIANLYASQLTNIDEFLEKWNISVESAVVMDDTSMINTRLSSLSGTASAPVVTVEDSDAVGDLPNSTLPIVAPFSRAIDVLSKNSDIITTEVLKSSSSSYLVALTEDTEVSDENASRNTVVLSSREKADGFDVYTSNLLVIGSAYMADPSVISSTSTYNNANVLLNITNTMTGKESSVVIPQKNLETETLALTSSQSKVLSTIVIYIFPLIVVVIGVFVLARRRNR